MAGNETFSKELKRKIEYNTKVMQKYFRRKRYGQCGARKRRAFPLLVDDLDIMEQIDIFDTMG